ncbi:enoyl-CoA hydratase-related protein [Rhodalgimonas zhirmunskyi]|uniref:Enoyl-CoA hydratase-related protein n=1 Tax=Rhodalgimonas zhirmunskyi TaxID=2964767 RepID=A0AAJ1X737_9RHOB|nr:enoyl-CoA hydratase-related protein [Rhodoalgimonas zhirmunskyi]MDQ2095304.1 enoyl-CoA hydratase-related protein [Rhodoalgimonas zhirmunskyi]
MSDKVEYRIDGAVAVLSVLADGARPGPLDRATRAALMEALERAEGDDRARGVVITGSGRGFAAGVPFAELQEGSAGPSLSDLTARIARCAKPVIAAMRGDVRDGALDLALAARARVAVAGTRVAHGAVALGLIPQGGATQTLPRLIGAEAAIDFLLSVQWRAADAGALAGLCDAVVARNVVGAAVAMAADPPARRDPPPGFADPLGYQAEIHARLEAAPETPEARAMIDAVAAAQLLPLAEGMAREAVQADDLRRSARARALIHAARAARRAARPAEVPLPEVVCVLGDGAAAFAAAQALLDTGLSVDLAEQRKGGAAALAGQLGEAIESDVAAGRLTAGAAKEMRARLTGGPAEARLRGARLVVEACAAPLRALDTLVDVIAGAVAPDVPVLIGSNTGLLAGRMAQRVAGNGAGLLSGRVLGVAWQPGRASRFVELVVPDGADPGAVAVAESLMARMRREVIRCKPVNGLVVQRLRAALFAAAEWCVRHGVAPHEVDRALHWPRGPFAMMDAEGLAAQGLRLRALGQGEARADATLGTVLLAQGREGRRSRAGVFRYDGHAVHPDPAIGKILAQWRGTHPQRQLSEEDIRLRLWTALCAAGLECLDQGVVGSAGEVDLAGIEALGLPRASGGPMQVGESRGLVALRRDLRQWSEDDPTLWHESRTLDEAIKLGGKFAE